MAPSTARRGFRKNGQTGASMDRWLKITYLESLGISLTEQISLIIKDLPVYNNLGQRIVERNYDEPLQPGCYYLQVEDHSFEGGPSYYCSWEKSHKLLKHFRYKTSELIDFLERLKNEPLVAEIIEILPHHYFEGRNCSYKSELLSAQMEIEKLNSKITHLEKQLYLSNNIKSLQKTSLATESRQLKAIHEWIATVEKAVALAVDCARQGKPRSIQQHKSLWRQMWGEAGNKQPRKEGFAAFRRGLPDDLKQNPTKS